ncbi:MAG TPA: aminotransferase class I/II-fold pyridoxal phosphate-dependent enzyme, partial [Alphaproteobacteria bacterium]|nr:aminotransferase class I/II-fold pyridoxal phosphate-dependent enzyme [Alphaproteobacteria bacterium]
GLTFDQAAIDASIDAIRQAGTGTTGSRIANGTYSGHAELENQIADFFGRRSAMVFTTGYQANLGLISTVAGKGDHLLIDADSHASIYDACKLSAAEIIRFRHNDPKDLERRLRRLEGLPGSRIVVTEGLFSMLGDTAPLREIAAVKREMGAYLIVDEAHSMGVMGKHGRGLAEVAGVEADVDFIVGTFSKSLGAIGGFAVSDLPGFDLLRVVCRPYMFTASLPPAIVASVSASLNRIATDNLLGARVQANSRRLHNGLAQAGFDIGQEANPVCAIRIADSELAIRFWNALVEGGVYLNLALPPATPASLSLIRSSVSAAHTEAQIDRAVSIIAYIGGQLGVLSENATRIAMPAAE